MSTLQERINELLKESGKKAVELADYIGRDKRAVVSAWTSGKVRSITGENAKKVAKFFNVNVTWVIDGAGPKYPQQHYGDSEKLKLIGIIEQADKAMDDSGVDFTDEERLENYFSALEFAGRQHFSKEFVGQYMVELLKSGRKAHS